MRIPVVPEGHVKRQGVVTCLVNVCSCLILVAMGWIISLRLTVLVESGESLLSRSLAVGTPLWSAIFGASVGDIQWGVVPVACV